MPNTRLASNGSTFKVRQMATFTAMPPSMRILFSLGSSRRCAQTDMAKPMKAPTRTGPPIRKKRTPRLSPGKIRRWASTAKPSTETRLLKPTRVKTIPVTGPSASYSRITIKVAAGAVATAIIPRKSAKVSEVCQSVRPGTTFCRKAMLTVNTAPTTKKKVNRISLPEKSRIR